MENVEVLEQPLFQKEDREIATILSLQDSGVLTKVEQSPAYKEIIRAFVRLRNSPKFSQVSLYRLAATLDKELTLSNIRTWLVKLERQKKQEWDARVKQISNEALDVNATTAQIRDISLKVFSLKIQEFLRDPSVLEKMTFSEAKKLYIDIEKLHLLTQEMNLKHREQGRKDAFTLFSMGLAAGEYDEGDVDDLLVERENGTKSTITNPS